jgi:hypothetical protein
MDTQALQGYWWLPEASEEDHVAGTLYIEHGRLPRLNLIGSLEADPHILTLRTEPLILGVLDRAER